MMKRMYHHYDKWEEIKAGMWRKIPEKERTTYLEKAIEFTGNAELYGSYMLRVLDEWPISCEQNLSNKTINRKAWIGHAASCLALDCPEDVTREAWHRLTEQQQDEANERARLAIIKWEKRIKKRTKHAEAKIGS